MSDRHRNRNPNPYCYLLDTDMVVDYLNDYRPGAEQVSRMIESPDAVAICIISYFEVYDGIYSGSNPGTAEAIFQQFLRRLSVVQLEEELVRIAARLRGQLRRAGQVIGDTDILIAATALHYDLTLVARNLRHYERVPGLRIHSNQEQT